MLLQLYNSRAKLFLLNYCLLPTAYCLLPIAYCLLPLIDKLQFEKEHRPAGALFVCK